VSPTSEGNGREIHRICIVGGAGFIGSHFVERLLDDEMTSDETGPQI